MKTDKTYPQLPEPARIEQQQYGEPLALYNAEQLQANADAALEARVEAVAKFIDDALWGIWPSDMVQARVVARDLLGLT